jgi:DNA ligase (NAD+)
MVEKANEIIPHIAAVVEGTSYDLEPTIKCPCCNSDMSLVDGKSEPTKDYVCPNEDCPARKTALLHAALGIRGINVMGIGPEICADFIAKYPDLNAATFLQLSPDEYPESMSELQRANLHKEARVARKAPLWRWISAMNIPDIGDTSAKTITRTCKNLREFIKAAMDPMYAPIDISDRRKEACKEYILSKGNVAQELLEMALNPESDNYVEKSDNAVLDGKSFVVTGSFEYGRAAIEDMIPKFGGVLKKSVSSKVDYVVCGSDPGTSKITKADKLQIPIISEAELFQLIQSNQNDN